MSTGNERAGGEVRLTATEETASPSAIHALIGQAALPDGAATEFIGPLLVSYVSRLRSHPPHDLLDAEAAVVFDPSWDEG